MYAKNWSLPLCVYSVAGTFRSTDQLDLAIETLSEYLYIVQYFVEHCFSFHSVGGCWAGIFKESMGAGTEEEEGYRTGPPGYIGWRNSFLGINSKVPYTFKNTGSGIEPMTVATLALAVRCSNHAVRFHQHSARSRSHSARSHPPTQLDLFYLPPCLPVEGRGLTDVCIMYLIYPIYKSVREPHPLAII